MTIIQRIRLAGVVGMLFITRSSLGAQGSGGTLTPEQFVRATATIALVRALPDPEAMALVLRRSQMYPKDVILIRAGTENAELLAASVALLLRARLRGSTIAQRDTVIEVRSGIGPSRWRTTETPRLTRWLSRLSATAPTYLEGVGMARTIQIPLRSTGFTEADIGN